MSVGGQHYEAPYGVPWPFFFCIWLPGHFEGAYANCKWRDCAAACMYAQGQAGVISLPLPRAPLPLPPPPASL